MQKQQQQQQKTKNTHSKKFVLRIYGCFTYFFFLSLTQIRALTQWFYVYERAYYNHVVADADVALEIGRDDYDIQIFFLI